MVKYKLQDENFHTTSKKTKLKQNKAQKKSSSRYIGFHLQKVKRLQLL